MNEKFDKINEKFDQNEQADYGHFNMISITACSRMPNVTLNPVYLMTSSII